MLDWEFCLAAGVGSHRQNLTHLGTRQDCLYTGTPTFQAINQSLSISIVAVLFEICLITLSSSCADC